MFHGGCRHGLPGRLSVAGTDGVDVQVWFLDLRRCPESALERLEQTILSPAERQRNRAILRPATRRAYVAAHGLKRVVLGRWVAGPLQFDRTGTGKPFLAGTDVHFNLSHTDGAAALAVSRAGPVGVDIESMDLRVGMPQIMAAALTPDEQARTRAAPEPREAFLRCWTAKEAYVKATGEGLGRRFDSLALCDGPCVAGRGVAIHRLHQVTLERHVLATCVLTARAVAFQVLSPADVIHAVAGSTRSDGGTAWRRDGTARCAVDTEGTP